MADKHISSTAIARTADAVELHLTTPLRGYRANIKPQTDLPPDAFGTVGELMLGSAYRDLQDTVEQLVVDAIDVTEEWAVQLKNARHNWRIAEDLAEAEASAIGVLR